MKLIDRWSLMRCTQSENVQEHAAQVSIIAHALATLKNRQFGGRVAADRVAVCALFHDATEVLTGDLPTPVKYYSEEIRQAYTSIEDHASRQLLGLLPEGLREDYENIFREEDPEVVRLVKAADVIAAFVKCLEEEAAGNHEFSRAKKTIESKLRTLCAEPEVEYFVKHFVPSFALNLDELSQPFESSPR